MPDGQLSRLPRSQYFTDDGTSTGSNNMAVDGSVTPVDFFLQPPADEVWRIHRVFIVIQDTGQYRPDQYGAIPTLATGVRMQLRAGTTPIAGTGSWTIRQNVDWDVFANRFQERLGQGARLSIVARLDSDAESPTRLVGSLNHNLALIINDDLTTLTDHRAIGSGYVEGELL